MRKAKNNPKDPNPNPSVRVFEWYENRVERNLRELYRFDVSQRSKIMAVVEEMKDSDTFEKLVDAYNWELRQAGLDEDEARATDALLCLLARAYAAGSLREAPVL